MRMENVRKQQHKLSRLALCFVVLALVVVLAPSAQAQTSGTVAISGIVNPAVKVTSGGAATLTGSLGGSITTPSPSNSALATVVDFGDVGPGNTNTRVCFVQPLFLRANAASTVSAALTASAFGGGAGDLAATDIGIGFQNLIASGPNADIVTTSVTGIFSADPCTPAIDADGIPIFSATLNNLALPTAVIVSTGPISLLGSFNATSNRADLDLSLSIVPQAFTTGTFSATVTLTMTSP